MDCCNNLKPDQTISGNNIGHKHQGHHVYSFIRKFWIACFITIPILAYSDITQEFLHWIAPQFSGSQYVSIILGTIIFFYCGWIFLSSAWRELEAKMPGMMTLIALAVTTAYMWSVYSTIANTGHALWWELSTLIAIMLLGHWIEMKAVQGAQRTLKELEIGRAHV